MPRFRRALPVPIVMALAAQGLAATGATAQAADPQPFDLDVLSTVDNGGIGTAEIVAFDGAYDRAYVVDAANTRLVVLDMSDPATPARLDAVDLSGAAPGGINSVAVRPGDPGTSTDSLVAVAGESADPTEPGVVVLLDQDGTQITTLTVGASPADGSRGALPDMVTFTPDGTKAIVASEGEPGTNMGGMTVDPEGVVSLIDVDKDPATIGQGDVTDLGFRAFNAGQSKSLAGVDGFAFDPDVASIARDIEPEYVAATNTRAFVTLQEVNGVAVVDLVNEVITEVLPLGYVDHSVAGQGLDVSDRDGLSLVERWPVQGVRQPDAVVAFEAGGQTYFATANEGDDRDDDIGIADVTLDPALAGATVPSALPAGTTITDDAALGRIALNPNLTRANGAADTDDDGDVDTLFTYGSRGFTIFDSAGAVVFDSGAAFEQHVVGDDLLRPAFNSDDPVGLDQGALVSDKDDRSDNKGPEPEGIEVGVVDGETYLFIGLERVGGIMVYRVTDPASSEFVTYLTTRNLSDYQHGVRDFDGDGGLSAGDLLDVERTGGDVSPEGIEFVAAADSPTGRPLLLVAHEVSGTVTTIELDDVVAAPPAAATPTPATFAPADVVRVSGATRYLTAIEVSKAAFPSADTVVLARGDEYADAVAGAPLAARLDAPLLLTRSDALPDEVLAEIQRLGATEVVVLGGPAAVSAAVVQRLEDANLSTRRLRGADRFATAGAIAAEVLDGTDVERVFLVEGKDPDPRRGWPDAVSVGALAGFLGSPILLTETDTLPQATLDAIQARSQTTRVTAIGGTAAITQAILDALDDTGLVATDRISGPNRYATSAAVHAAAVAAGIGIADRWVATGTAFPDALTAGAAAGATGQSLLLVPGADVTAVPVALDALTSSFEYAETIALVGGTAAISAASADAVAAAFAPPSATSDFCLTILHNNDGESQLIDAGSGLEDFGGAARFATRLLTERVAGEADDATCASGGVLTVTSGDNFLAGPEFNASRANDGPLFDSILYDYLDYDAIDVGNHDFDFGPAVLADFIGGISDADDVKFLSSNLDPSAVPALAAHVNVGRLRPSTTVDVDGTTVGVIGLTTPTIEFISSPGRTRVAGLDGLDSDLPVLASFVAREVDNVRADGAEVVVLISHLQDADTDLALAELLSEVDVVVAGGGDEILAAPGDLLVPGDEEEVFGPYPIIASDAEGDDVPVVTTAGSYKYVGRLDVRFDAAGDLQSVDPTSRMVRVAGGGLVDAVAPDAFVQANVVDPVIAFVEGLATDVIATSEVDLDGRRSSVRTQQSNVGALLADALRDAAQDNAVDFGLDPGAAFVAVTNGGGIRNDSVIAAGPVTRLDTFDIAPFSNFVAVFEQVSAAELDAILEHAYQSAPDSAGRFAQVANLVVTVDLSAAPGEKVTSITLGDGSPIPAEGVSLVTVDFLARGGDGYPTDGLGGFTSVGVSYQQALADFIVEDLGGTITATDYPAIGTDPINDGADRILYTNG